ncbi:MAG: SdrD B-like domain-containing protein, partial [Bacteroidota bacterium]
AGLYRGVNIGNFVWIDENDNGIQEVGEAGVADVQLQLIGAGPDGQLATNDDEIVDSQSTDENGNFMFAAIRPGAYILEVLSNSLPDFHSYTLAGAGNDENLDSNIDPATGRTMVSIVSGQADQLGVDVGLQYACKYEIAFDYSPDICATDLVDFSAAIASPGASYNWSFFDGPSSDAPLLGNGQGEEIDHAFASGGEKYVVLFVEERSGCKYTVGQTVFILENVSDGGSIGDSEFNCEPYQATTINNLSTPNGTNAAIEYQWLQSDQSTPPTDLNDPNWTLIPGANGSSYAPGFIQQTTYFVRMASRIDCSNFIGISNIIAKEVLSNPVAANFTYLENRCEGSIIEFYASNAGSGATYTWAFFNGPTSNSTFLGSANGLIGFYPFNSAGEKYIQLTVQSAGGCSATTSQVITVLNNALYEGTIDGDEFSCSTYDPGMITSLEPAEVDGGAVPQYIWLRSSQAQAPSDVNDINWSIIPGATGETYDPTTITASTYFVRVARSSICETYNAISNVIAKEVSPILTASFETSNVICEDAAADFVAFDNGPNAAYTWSFFNGSTINSTFLGGREGLSVDFTFTTPGSKFVRLFVNLPNGCSAVYDQVITVTDKSEAACDTGIDTDLLSFNVIPTRDNQARLTWTTSNEQPGLIFTIEHNLGGTEFNIVGAFPTDGSGSYTFTHELPIVGINQYRVKLSEADGSIIYSEIKEITIIGEILGTLFPNPATTYTTLSMVQPFGNNTIVEVVNANAIVIRRIPANPGSSTMHIDLSRTPSGYYYIYINDGISRKLVSQVFKPE